MYFYDDQVSALAAQVKPSPRGELEITDLNRLYRSTGALWRLDDSGEGFRWIEADDQAQSVFSFVRYGAPGEVAALCVLNATPVVRENYRLGVPREGRWREAINTDSAIYGGSDVGNAGAVVLLDETLNGLDPHATRRAIGVIEAAAAAGAAVLLSTHLLGVAERLCHRVVLMDEGAFIDERRRDGEPPLTPDTLERLYVERIADRGVV